MSRSEGAGSLRACLAVATIAAGIGLSLAASPLAAAEPTIQGSLRSLYLQLADPRPDGRSVPVEGLTLDRDVFRFEFTSGRFHLLRPAAGRTPGAVFLGRGSYKLTAATAGERRHLAFRLGDDGSNAPGDSFDAAILLFGDATEQEILAAGELASGPPSREAAELLGDLLGRDRAGGEVDYALRLLRGRVNDEGASTGPFYALVRGRRFPRAVVGFDPAGVLDGEQVCLLVDDAERGGFWYSDRPRRGAAATPVPGPLVDARHYTVDTRVSEGTSLAGSTVIDFEVRAPSLRVLPIDLLPSLRIREVKLLLGDEATPLEIAQEEDGDTAVFLAAPLARGEVARLQIDYAGTGVLEDDGVGTFSVGARSSWYPNLGAFSDRATYDLTFRVPKDNTVIAVGRQIEAGPSGGEMVSKWQADAPIAVAGFNYGSFKRYDKAEPNTGMSLEVFASTGTPDIIAEINSYLQQASGGLTPQQATQVAGDDSLVYLPDYSGPSSIGVSPDAVAEAAMADAVNTVQILTHYFGPLENSRLAITQQTAWNFGQAWPSLVYLPYLVGMSNVLQLELGLQGYAGFYDEVGIHEIAHQWWGHKVGWKSYRDQWLSEGFAEFSTALVVELTRGPEAYNNFWEKRRRAILIAPRDGGVAAHAAGPITLGFRAETERSPGAYSALAYSKGAYVLHMLRMLMRDAQSKKPDARFFAMMRDFATTHAGRNATTADFQAMVEKHMVPELNAGGDGKPDWFFRQWVNGTEVPRLNADVAIEKAGKGSYRLHGSLTQSGVSDDFLSLVGVYVDLGKGTWGQFGRSPFRGNMTRPIDVTLELPKKPKAVELNAFHEVLAFD